MAVVGMAALGASPATAQKASLSLGAGGVMPSGDYGTADKFGWQLMGAVETKLPRSPIAVRVDVLYGQTTHDGFTGSTKLTGASANAVYNIGAKMVPVRLYVLGGLGYYHVGSTVGSFSGGETKPSFNAGTGVRLGMGPMKVFGEARFMSILTSGSSLNFFPVTVGLTFGM